MSNNICNYSPLETISRKAIDHKFNAVHRYLCYLGAATGSGGASITPGQISIGGQPAITYGGYDFQGDGVTTSLSIPHGLGVTPTFYFFFNDTPVTTNFLNRTITADDTNIYVNYGNPPGPGEDAWFVWLAAM